MAAKFIGPMPELGNLTIHPFNFHLKYLLLHLLLFQFYIMFYSKFKSTKIFSFYYIVNIIFLYREEKFFFLFLNAITVNTRYCENISVIKICQYCFLKIMQNYSFFYCSGLIFKIYFIKFSKTFFK